MQCSEEALVRLFNNTSSSFELLLIFIYVLTIILAKIFYFLGGNLSFQRNDDDFEYIFSDEEMEEEEEQETNQSFLDQSIQNNDHVLIFSPSRSIKKIPSQELASPHPHFHKMQEEYHEDEQWRYQNWQPLPNSSIEHEETSSYGTILSEFEQLSDDDDEDTVQLNPTTIDSDSVQDSETNDIDAMSPFPSDQTQYGSLNDSDISQEKSDIEMNQDESGNTRKLTRERENYLSFVPSKSQSKKINVQEKNDEGGVFGDSCTNGSTSKSSDWRSSINFSGTEDPFSSSSRRSCPNWESYTVFQKYDEEMTFLDRITAQKLSETESLRSIQACPRSISERIVYKIAPRNNRRPMDFRHNPYHELESAYVAQISWTWEALSWNYKYFLRLRESRRQDDPGCPAIVAQQFQQFLVRLQRYVENEPYEHGRRPEIYARIKSLAPKLLQVPEYRDSEDEKKDEGYSSSSRISSDAFLAIIEETIRTFMNFLEADKENRCQIIAGFFRKNTRGSADPTLLLLLKKINQKKKMKVKDIRRSRKCLRRRRRVRETDEMEILMALIDLKLVSRVLRMSDLNDELLHWCEDKMSKVRVVEGKLFRDSSPLFFPPQ